MLLPLQLLLPGGMVVDGPKVGLHVGSVLTWQQTGSVDKVLPSTCAMGVSSDSLECFHQCMVHRVPIRSSHRKLDIVTQRLPCYKNTVHGSNSCMHAAGKPVVTVSGQLLLTLAAMCTYRRQWIWPGS